MKRKKLVKRTMLVLLAVAATCFIVPAAFAQEEHAEEGEESGNGIRSLGLGIGAGLAVGIAGIGTGLAQSGVGAGGTGAIAEKPELFGQVLILFAIPETIVLFGFVIGILLLGNI